MHYCKQCTVPLLRSTDVIAFVAKWKELCGYFPNAPLTTQRFLEYPRVVFSSAVPKDYWTRGATENKAAAWVLLREEFFWVKSTSGLSVSQLWMRGYLAEAMSKTSTSCFILKRYFSWLLCSNALEKIKRSMDPDWRRLFDFHDCILRIKRLSWNMRSLGTKKLR